MIPICVLQIFWIVWPLTIQLLSYVISCLAFWWCSIASLGPYCAGCRAYLAYRALYSIFVMLSPSIVGMFYLSNSHREQISSSQTKSTTYAIYDSSISCPGETGIDVPCNSSPSSSSDEYDTSLPDILHPVIST